MFDDDALFSDAQALSADAYSTNAVEIDKTPEDGLWIEVAATAMATTAYIDIYVLEKAADSAWSYTDETQRMGNFRVTGSGSRAYFHVQSKLAYLKLYYNGDAWGTATVTAGIVSGPQRETCA